MSWLAVACTLVAIIVLHVAADRWWPTIALLFGPRWILLALPMAAVPWLMIRPRHGVVPFVAAMAGVLFGVMDLRVGLRRGDAPGTPMRIVEFNMAGNAADEAALITWLSDVQPDLVFLVECKPDRGSRVAIALAMQVRSSGSLCLLSRWAITEWSPREQRAFWKRYGSGAIVRGAVATTQGSMRIGIVHLATPRHVLDTFFDLSGLVTQGGAVAENMALRDDESAAARAWIGDPDSVAVIAGDFNLPVESAIYRRHWSGYDNAFSRSGRGFGRTKRTRLIGVRIDHVLTGRGATAMRASIGPDLGSDHRPLMVDVRVRADSANDGGAISGQ